MLEDKLGIEVSTEPDRRFIKVYGHTLDKYEPFRDAKTLYKKVGIFKNALELLQGDFNQIEEALKQRKSQRPKTEFDITLASVRGFELSDDVSEHADLSKQMGLCYSVRLNKAIYSITGRNSYNLLKQINALMYKVFVKPIPKQILLDHCFGKGGKLQSARVNLVLSRLQLLQQAYDDNNRHISPILLYTGKTAHDLRQNFGKGAWKSICSNSFSRNKRIAQILDNRVRRGVQYQDDWKRVILAANHLPTTLVSSRLIGFRDDGLYDGAKWCGIHLKGKYKDVRLIDSYAQKYADTLRMMRQLALAEDELEKVIKWSPRRLTEEHDNFSRRVLMKDYSDEPFAWIDSLGIGDFHYNGYDVIILKSPLSMKMEGESMSHCVGAYSSQVAQGSYITFSVMKDGERSSTIGLYRSIEEITIGVDDIESKFQSTPEKKMFVKYGFSQQYGRFNRPVKDPVESEIPSFILGVLNNA